MANNRELLKEALADAKSLREMAITNAKAALEEAFDSRMKDLLSRRISEMDKEEIEILRNKIFNSRINKIGNAYIQELRGEAFIDIK